MKKAKIFYFSLTDEQTKDEKLAWFGNTKLKNIDFERIEPDKTNNWLDQSDNDFDSLIPVCSKDAKNSDTEGSIFKLYSLGVATNRDEWVYDLNKEILAKKIQFFCDVYESEQKKWRKSINKIPINDFVDRSIKWTTELEAHLTKGSILNFKNSCIRNTFYRPYYKEFLYYEKIIIHRLYQSHNIFLIQNKENNNIVICISGQSANKPFQCLSSNQVTCLDFLEKTQCLPLYRYDKEGSCLENITDWGLNKFHIYYKNQNITKENIFHYVYAVLHNPAYRQKYEQNLKREFPRIPFYANFFQWTEWGQKLMELHINYETIELYPLKRLDIPSDKTPKPKLKADKIANKIILDDITTLENIPKIAREYKLGNRSALEWILDQYKEKKPKDPTIAEKFNTYKFADYKEQVIELLQRVCTVSVETMQIIQLMEKIDLP